MPGAAFTHKFGSRQDQETLPGCSPWMFTEDEGKQLNPCEVAVELMKVCQKNIDNDLSKLISGSNADSLRCPLSKKVNQDCCCSTTSYALLSACLVCRKVENVNIDEPTYKEFSDRSNCQSTPAVSYAFPQSINSQVDDVRIPSWAMIPVTNLSATWDINAAEREAEKQAVTSNSSSVPTTSEPSDPESTSSSPSAVSTAPPTSSSTVISSTKKSTSPGTIAGAVIGGLVLFSLLAYGAFLLSRRRRRLALRPTAASKLDLADPGIEEKRTSNPVDLLDGEDPSRPRSPTFPFPFEWVVRRYHPNAPHSIEPPRTDIEGEPEPAPPVPAAQRTRMPSIRRKPKKPPQRAPERDQLERDLADLRGSDHSTPEDVEASSSSKPAKRSRRKSFLAGIGKQSSISSPSVSAPSDRDKHSAHSDRRAEGKYYHLPPSAQFLANVARYPQNIDPERPWDVKATE